MPDRDATRYIGALGVRGEITPRLRSTIRVGYEVREPDRGDLGEYSGVVVGGEVVSTPTARTRLTLVLERAVQESVFAGNEIYLANLATLAAEFYLTPKLLLSGRVFGGNAEYFEKVRKVNGAFAWRTDWLYAASVGVYWARRRSPACST